MVPVTTTRSPCWVTVVVLSSSLRASLDKALLAGGVLAAGLLASGLLAPGFEALGLSASGLSAAGFEGGGAGGSGRTSVTSVARSAAWLVALSSVVAISSTLK